MPKINNPIEPQTQQDTYPTHRSKYGQGGIHSVKTVADRDDIPYNRLEKGMLVYVSDENIHYVLVTNARLSENRVWTRLSSGGGGGGAEIDDDHITTAKVWSSSKTNNTINSKIDDTAGETVTDKTWSAKKISEEISQGGAQIDDTRTLTTKVWSSNKTYNTIVQETENLIKDDEVNIKKVWSSNKTKTELDKKSEIDDDVAATQKTWSSIKTKTYVDEKIDDTQDLNDHTWSSRKTKTYVDEKIDDDQELDDHTWSSNKIQTELDKKAEISDSTTVTDKTWSSDKIRTEIDLKINDAEKVTDKTWSSDKIRTEIDNQIDDTQELNDHTWSSIKTKTYVDEKIDDTQDLNDHTWSSRKTKTYVDEKIDDSAVDIDDKTWSSTHIQDRIDEKINDTQDLTDHVWSSDKTKTYVDEKIDDENISEETTWSSDKIQEELDKKSSLDNYGLPVKIEKEDNYVFSMDYNELDYTFAYENIEGKYKLNPGSCAAIWKNGILGRNFDWNYNKEAEVVVKVPDSVSYFGSVSICGGLSGITQDAIINDTVLKEDLKLLPFYARDGVNTKGLSAAILVVPKLENTHAEPSVEVKHEVDALTLVRYVLDNFSSADGAVDYLSKYVKINVPESVLNMGYEVHWMIADKNKAYWVEIINNKLEYGEFKENQENVLTNFHYYGVNWDEEHMSTRNYRVFTPADQSIGKAHGTLNIDSFGQGLERYNAWILNEAIIPSDSQDAMLENLGNIVFTNTYKDLTPGENWYSEFAGQNSLTVDNTPADYQDIVTRAREKFTTIATDEERREDGILWHTLHSCSYDLENKNFKVKFNEGASVKQYFAPISQSGGGGVEIDDTVKVLDKTWSSKKISEMIDDTKGEGDLENTWSADKSSFEIKKMIDDDKISNETTWSSEETEQRINDKLSYKTEYDGASGSLTIFMNNPLKEGLKFIARNDNSSVKLDAVGLDPNITLLYSINEADWQDYVIGEVITLNKKGDYVILKNKSNQDIELDEDKYYQFVMTGQISADGSVNYLYRNDGSEPSFAKPYQFHKLFENCTSLVTPPKLGSALTSYCFKEMFKGCTSLIKAPKITYVFPPVTECYREMFNGCSSLKISNEKTSKSTEFFTYGNYGPDDAAQGMFSGTGGTFTGNPSANVTYYYYQ